ncbi:MFS transporter [Pseudomonas sp. URIL14HWK12:I6]|uniref:MFS transporter n=1 Tax=Pseudomonas sp. URIL14HWK12:I6 TaxID=1283293 RepID=UPI00048434F1|nr:MFS transporter [Pseudomonas sp. URIL14HWK12:I6]
MQTASEGIVPRARVPVLLFAISAGVMITNIFAPQTLVSLLTTAFGLDSSSGGLIAMISLLGYAAGLCFLIPLADLVENRRLVLQMLTAGALSAAGILFAPNATTLFMLLFILGASCSVIQVLLPSAASMAAPEQRGRVIGDIMSGLMVGILLSRPIASFLAGTWGWKAFYVFSCTSTILLGLTLSIRLPRRQPGQNIRYSQLISSLWHLFKDESVLRHRAISAAIVMAAFNFFWTTIVYVLEGAPFEMGQKGIALFALVGAGGAIVTPMVGRWSDRGHGRRVTNIAHVVLMAGFVLAAVSGLVASLPVYVMLIGLGVSALLLDMGVLGNQTVGRYMINLLNPDARGRINAIFVATFFVGGALGSALSGMLWSVGGWGAVCAGGVVLGLVATMSPK